MALKPFEHSVHPTFAQHPFNFLPESGARPSAVAEKKSVYTPGDLGSSLCQHKLVGYCPSSAYLFRTGRTYVPPHTVFLVSYLFIGCTVHELFLPVF